MKAQITDIMGDLETLDTSPSAVVLSIGLVAFNRRDTSVPMKELYLKMGTKELRDEQLRMGRTIDRSEEGSLEWWKKQSPEAKRIFKEVNLGSVMDALETMTMFIKQFDVNVLVWGNGAAFDNVILISLYKSFGMTPPWKFWNDRCFRTMKGEHGHIARPPEPMQGTKHNAVDDARQQARYLQAIYAELQKYNIKSYKERQS